MIAIAAFLAACAAFLVGCEDNNTPDSFNDSPGVTALRIAPSSTTIGPTNTYAVFEAFGGMGPFSWSVADAALGTIPVSTAHIITYTRVEDAFGANVITVRDANGWVSTAEISQPETTGNE